jgi:tripartite-type tricarboxylate transporter receptor subunit TctC
MILCTPYVSWWGLWGPAGMPASVVDKLEKDVARSLATPELRKLFSKIGVEPISMTSAEFAKFVRSEMEAVTRTVKETGIKPKYFACLCSHLQHREYEREGAPA